MKRFVATGIILVFAVIGCSLALFAYKNYRLFHASLIASDHEVHLERRGSFTVVAAPAGRSMFRPGGVVEIYLGGPESDGDVLIDGIDGKGTVTLIDRNGRVCLDEKLEDWPEGRSSLRGKFIRPIKEFDTSAGGPYEIRFDIVQPFASLSNVQQVLSVYHFVCGNEAILHMGQFGASGLFLGVSGFLGYRMRTATKRIR